jgi:hypothetical protein
MKVPISTLRALLLPSAMAIGGTVAACQGCRSTPELAAGVVAGGQASGAAVVSAGLSSGTPPTVRLYLMSSVAGALEPCGCSKNQLGGFDHVAALVASQKAFSPGALLAAAGPLFFPDPVPRGDHATQDTWKADAIASSLSRLGFVGWAPGANDWAAGAQQLAALCKQSGGALLGANLAEGAPGVAPVSVKESGGYKVGFIGISSPLKMGLAPEGVVVKPPREALRAGIDEARKQGAQILVGLLAMPRGDALRLAETAPELHVVAVGKPFDQGEANDKPSPPVLLGSTLVVEAANHLQTLAVVDLHVRDGQLKFQDAAGIAREADRSAVSGRIEELEKKIRAWEQSPSIDPKDLAARRADLAHQRDELRKLETPPPPSAGSFFRYTMAPIRQDAGRDEATYQAMLAYYQKVNDHNRVAFADRKPQPAGPDGNRYIGIDACSKCHAAAREVWNNTPHSRAYKTLSDQHKEFNLDCVSCHVTGYERPGGSTVTSNDALRDVQCESCHGPGELHRKAPADKALIIGKPRPESCVSGCHHPPHVEGFDPVAMTPTILGKGHGDVDAWRAAHR